MLNNVISKFNILKRQVKKHHCIGIPRGLVNSGYEEMWELFFLYLGQRVVFSKHSNKSIVQEGLMLSPSELCLPVKIFFGHIKSLEKQCDFIFIPRIIKYSQNKLSCPQFCAIVDLVKLSNIVGEENKILVCDFENSIEVLADKEARKIAQTLNLRIEDVLNAYSMAYIDWKKRKTKKFSLKSKSLNAKEKPLKIGILGHQYLLDDEYFNLGIKDKLLNMGCEIPYLEQEVENLEELIYSQIGEKRFWNAGYENLGKAYKLSRDDEIRGIIYVSAFSCGMDPFIVEKTKYMIEENQNISFMHIYFDEHSGEAGIDTRIEAFVDSIRQKILMKSP